MSGAVGHEAAPEPILTGWQGLELQGVSAHAATYLILKHIREGI
jgi:hypothetical protein